MIFRVTMQDPDALHDEIQDVVEKLPMDGLDDEEAELVREKRAEKVGELCGKWFEYDEYLTVEIDTEAGTCVVVPNEG